MSVYRASYAARYKIPSILEQIEVAIIHAATDILNEDAGTPDHANREKWAKYTNSNSATQVAAFGWPVGLNPTIAAAIQEDPNGATVSDNDVQFVVAQNVGAVIEDWVANQPA